MPDGIEIGDTCAFWYDNKDTMGSANWGFMNLDQWNVSPGEQLPQRRLQLPVGLDRERLSRTSAR